MLILPIVLALGFNGARGEPVGQVTALIEQLIRDGERDQKDEAASFAAYNQNCRTWFSQKQAALAEMSWYKDMMQQEVDVAQAQVDLMNTELANLRKLGANKKTGQLIDEQRTAITKRNTQQAANTEHADNYAKSIEAIKDAWAVIEKKGIGGFTGAFLQVSEHLEQQDKDKLHALLSGPDKDADYYGYNKYQKNEDNDMLHNKGENKYKVGWKTGAGTTEQMQENGIFGSDGVVAGSRPGESVYTWRSQKIVDLLKSVQRKFEAEYAKVKEEAANNFAAWELLISDLGARIKVLGDTFHAKKGELQLMQSQLAVYTESRDEHLASIAALKEAQTSQAATCQTQQELYADRKKTRTEEVNALRAALAILSTDSLATAGSQRLVPKLGTAQTEEYKTWNGETASKTFYSGGVYKYGKTENNVYVEGARGEKVSLAQLRTNPKDTAFNKLKFAAWLSKQGRLLNSKLISALATKASSKLPGFDDPNTTMGKLKALIENLIRRLALEQDEEKDHQTWCGENIKQNQDARAKTQIDMNEKRAQKLQSETTLTRATTDYTTITEQIAVIGDNLAAAAAKRIEDKASNEQKIKDAKASMISIEKAVGVLQQFIADNRNPTAAPAAAGMDDEVFMHSGYAIKKAHLQKVIAILEVASAEMQTLQVWADEGETRSQIEYKNNMEKDKYTQAVKQRSKAKLEKEKDYLKDEIDALTKGVDTAAERMEKLMDVWNKLKPACSHTEMSYEDRQKARNKEIKVLQQALQLLECAKTGNGGNCPRVTSYDSELGF